MMMADSARPASPDSLQMGIGVGMGMAVEVASIRRAFLGSGFGGWGFGTRDQQTRAPRLPINVRVQTNSHGH